MKIYIGPYTSWIGPYQIAEKILFWLDKDDDLVFKFAKWLSHGSKGEKHRTWLLRFCSWIHSKKERKIKVHIDPWDTWSMDTTLSYIILPMLKQLKVKTHGAPYVDDEDVPEELKSTSAPPKENEYDTDENHFKRWDYVLDEMIFAFEHKIDDDWEKAFESGKRDIITIPIDGNGNEVAREDAEFFRLGKGPNDTYVCDYDGMEAVHTRMKNGFRLFGKYYQGLWD